MTAFAALGGKSARAVVLIALAAGALGAGGIAPALSSEPDDMTMGRASAGVTVVEYASAGCPHCAAWANDVFPKFKAKYVDTGQVRFVLREELAGDPTLAAAGFLTARCAGPGKYFDVLAAVFRNQALIAEGGDAFGPLSRIAADAGVSAPAFKACLSDAAATKALQDRANRHVEVDKVEATPTFLVNGEKLEGEKTLAELDRAIAAARRR